MTIAQCKAARRNMMNDPRYKPKKGSRGLSRAMSIQRKVINRGGGARSIGYKGKKGG